MKKIVSYSIVELIVVMLISTLVISFCYTALEFTSERNQAFTKKSDLLYEHESFVNQLQKDLLNAQSIKKKGHNILIITADSFNREYSFGDSTLLTINQETLSFKVKTRPPELFYLGEVQHVDNEFVDKIRLPIVIQKETITVDFLKSYGADVLLSNQYERD